MGKKWKRIRYEISTVTITWWTGTSLARFNLVDARWRYFGYTTTVSTWLEPEHLEVSSLSNIFLCTIVWTFERAVKMHELIQPLQFKGILQNRDSKGKVLYSVSTKIKRKTFSDWKWILSLNVDHWSLITNTDDVQKWFCFLWREHSHAHRSRIKFGYEYKLGKNNSRPDIRIMKHEHNWIIQISFCKFSTYFTRLDSMAGIQFNI